VAKARDNRLAVVPSSAVTITVSPPPIGTGVGLRADYYDNNNFTGTRVRRVDPVVSFDWAFGSPDPLLGSDTFSVRWLGQVQPRYSESYTFYTLADDGVRLWVNGQLLIDRWANQSQTEWSGVIALQGGVLYDIRLEYYDNTGSSGISLRWSAPSVSKEIVPSTVRRHFPGGTQRHRFGLGWHDCQGRVFCQQHEARHGHQQPVHVYLDNWFGRGVRSPRGGDR
jgi:hypothetical protein